MSKIVEITLDFETYYSKKEKYSLSAKGMTYEKYIRNPKFEIIGLAVKEYNRPAKWLAPHEIQDWIDYVAGAYGWENVRVIAHNAMFDMAILGWLYNVYPYQVADTMLMSRAVMLWDGNSLDIVTKQLREKFNWGLITVNGVKQGQKLVSQVDFEMSADKGTEVHDADGKHLMDFTDEEYDQYADYAMNDVDLTKSAYDWFIKEFKYPEKEIDVMTMTLEMFTYPVMELDKRVLLEVQKDVENARESLRDKVGLSVEQLRSDAIFADALRSLGVEPPTKLNSKGEVKYAFAKSDLAFLKLLEHDDPNVVDLVQARLGNKSSQAVTRVQTFIDMAGRGLLPIPIEYYGARTGRFSGGSGCNVQNLNRNKLVSNATKFGQFVFYKGKADRVVEVRDDGKVHLARAGVVDNSEEDLHEFGLRDSFVAPKGKKLVVNDLAQIECVAGDGVVLTNNGLKKICEISTSDLVFDGVEYVSHDGVMFKGVKDVIEYCGVVGTPDHIVYTRSGEPITLDQAAFSKAELSTGGPEWNNVWEMGGTKQAYPTNDKDDQSLVQMPMRFSASSCDKRPKKWKIHRLSKMWERTRKSLRRLTRKTTQSVTGEIQCVTRSCESEQVYQPNLCECREPLLKLRRICPLYVEYRSERRLHRVGVGSYRHKRTLRKGKSTFCHKRAKCTNSQMQCYGGVQWGLDVSINVRQTVCAEFPPRHREQKNTQGFITRSHYFREPTTQVRMVGVQGRKNDTNSICSPIQQRKGAVPPFNESNSPTRFTELGNVIIGTIPVYDIINCGPRHRFCYNGVIVSNCRVLAWVSGEQWVLDAFIAKKDIYKATASQSFGVPYEEVTKAQRFTGKAQVLGLGYQAGVNGLKVVLGKKSEDFDDDTLQSWVTSYRQSVPKVVALWGKAKTALGAMVSGVSVPLDDLGVLTVEGNTIKFPNGMRLVYRHLEKRQGDNGFGEFWYWGKNQTTGKPGWEKTFQGRVVENFVQGIARIVLTDQMLDIRDQFAKRGWGRDDAHLCMQVHDEVICCCKEEIAEEVFEIMQHCMSKAPKWAVGLPLGSDGDIAQRYGAAK